MTSEQEKNLFLVSVTTAWCGIGMVFGMGISDAIHLSSPDPTFTRGAYTGMVYLADQLRQERPRFPLTGEGLVYRAWAKFVEDQPLEPMEPREKQLYDCAFEAAVNQCANGFILQGPIIVPCGGTVSNLTVTLVRGECAIKVTGDARATIANNSMYLTP